MAASSHQKPSSRRDSQDDSAPTEQTPLLGGGQLAPDVATEAATLDTVSETATLIGNDRKAAVEKPLPRMQIFLLCFARAMEPVAFFSIFPFIAEMVHRIGDVPDSDVGFYSGLIESLFSATQMVVLIHWGRLADRIGRKPALLNSLVGMALGPMLFCASTSLWQMIFFRCLAGAFSGSGLIIRTMIAENSTPDTQARAFSWFAFAGNVGIFIGPIIGGALADPAEQYPSLFGGVEFFDKYPYALAGFATGGISVTGALVSALFLKETLTKEEPGANGNANGQSDSDRPSMWELIKSPGVGVVLGVYSLVAFLAFAFTAIIPVALYTPVHLGGLEFGPSMISAYMASQGACQALWLLLAFPFLQRRFGTKGVMKGCGIAYPFFFAGYIALNLLLREGSHSSTVTFWVLGIIVAFIGPGVSMVFTGSQLALNDVSPNSHVLGTLNAIALTGSSAIRSVIPGVSTAIYAIGVRNQILAGHLAWVMLIPCAVIYAVSARLLPEGRKPHRATEDDEEVS